MTADVRRRVFHRTVKAMNDGGKGRLVYSTGIGRMCPDCGRPVRDCTCGTRTAKESLPSQRGRMVVKLRMEKKGRGGKTVTVVAGLPRSGPLLRDLCQELKRACGTGGTVSEDTIELQGDLRDRVREHLLKKEFVVKG
jgi:translation initiation factor 1